ncbi:glutathione ABC transporter permease GsiD [Desulfovibrio psychrotolerans]|uniref:Glutathione ABC transporter permease GsiD n=1 Tax=Desulfovibrio psychrotolerans TaxID=415242 RepID=A0A7J0BQQ6_9BACT|nr:glutathione ABC transporter permease GsiD [Desulfovibrio psychrotolerans]
MAVACLGIIGATLLLGIFAPLVAPNDPLEANIMAKFRGMSWDYPLGTDQQGRCVLSRLIYGVRPTILLSLLTMGGTIALGGFLGVVSGYFRGAVDEIIMRACDVMLSFPSQVMILAVVGMLGVGIENVIIANILIKWAWYARMIRGSVLQHSEKGFVIFSRTTGAGTGFILWRHIVPSVLPEIIVLASLDAGWVIINISTLSFLGLGVQAPAPEWGAMLNEARHVMVSYPQQMLAPGLAVLTLVACFNLLGDSLRGALEVRGR